jgi:hypothetical protein
VSATVKRYWYLTDGSLPAEDETVVNPLNTVMFSPVLDWKNPLSHFEVQGWVRLTSNHPIAPWGETPFRTSAARTSTHSARASGASERE